MLCELNWSQFAAWLKYAEIEPFGEERGDLRMAVSTSAIVNNARALEVKRPPLTTPEDFMVITRREKRRTTKARPLKSHAEYKRLVAWMTEEPSKR